MTLQQLGMWETPRYKVWGKKLRGGELRLELRFSFTRRNHSPSSFPPNFSAFAGSPFYKRRKNHSKNNYKTWNGIKQSLKPWVFLGKTMIFVGQTMVFLVGQSLKPPKTQGPLLPMRLSSGPRKSSWAIGSEKSHRIMIQTEEVGFDLNKNRKQGVLLKKKQPPAVFLVVSFFLFFFWLFMVAVAGFSIGVSDHCKDDDSSLRSFVFDQTPRETERNGRKATLSQCQSLGRKSYRSIHQKLLAYYK